MRIEAVYGVLIPLLGTTLGAACVFFMRKNMKDGIQRSLTGFASGVMVAASVWSLLIPSIEQSESMAEEIKDKLTASGVADQIEVTAYSKYVMLNVNGGVLFDSGKAELTPQALTLLDKVADALIEYDGNIITVEGHTDNVPINTSLYPNNMMLSLYRAYSVFDFFVSNKGFSDQTMTSSGRGDAVPIADNGTPEGRAQNRRVEIKVYNAINS